MSQVYKAHRKSEGKDGKVYWNAIGLTVFIGEWQGSPSVTLVDERTGERYPCFPPKPRTGPAGEREAPPIDDAPF